jgi:hypothetical protein
MCDIVPAPRFFGSRCEFLARFALFASLSPFPDIAFVHPGYEKRREAERWQTQVQPPQPSLRLALMR